MREVRDLTPDTTCRPLSLRRGGKANNPQPSAKKKGNAESAEIRKHENRKDAKGAKTKGGITTKNAEGVEGGFLITPHPFLLPGGEGTLERAIPEGACRSLGA